jgi:hypothetical protein
MCSAPDTAKQQEAARRAEQARLAALKKKEDARILKETLEAKTNLANRESAAANLRQSYSAKSSLLETDDEEAKKSLLSNYG